MDSVHSFLDAAGTFFDHVADVRPGPLALAILLHLANLLVLRTRAWLNILRAAYPGVRIRWRDVIGAYVAGVGINSFAPARGGDVVKIYAIHQVETVFDFAVATGLLAWAYGSRRLPQLPDMPNAPAFEWSFFARNTRAIELTAIIATVVIALGIRWLGHHVRAFWARVRQGVAVLATPGAYLRGVALYQGIGWCCRVGTAYFMLEAFGVRSGLSEALLVIVIGSLSTLLPVTPGGAGAQQALSAIVLAGAASQSQVLAYSVGAQVTITVVNAVAGLIALFALFGHLRLRHIRGSVRADGPPSPG
jgi:hypothetical protein